ncbi:MAG TPA: hypothetical protein VI818_01390 [Candidatus Thermoplasmatota archaeon]|nr:hypothetical protein [Candidatus Thermoplasmatota archaeon]
MASLQAWPQPIAGVTMAALAAWLLYLNFNHPLHRALSLFLFSRAATNFFQPFLSTAGPLTFADRVYPYFIIVQFFAGVYLAYVYRQRFAGQPVRPWVGLGLALGALLFEFIYVMDHALWGTAAQPGVLAAFRPLRVATYITIALLFIAEYSRIEEGPRRRALFLASVAFALDAVYLTVLFAAAEFGFDPGRFGQGGSFFLPVRLFMVAACLLLAAVLEWQRRRARDENARRLAKAFLGLFGVVVTTGLVTIAVAAQDPTRFPFVYNVFDGVWTLAFPTLLAYAILRHRLFGIETQARRAIGRSSLAAGFLLAFFIIAELTASFAERFVGRFGWLVGAIAAGSLLFALEPLHRWSRRVAEAAVPHLPAPGAGRTVSTDLYQEAARIAWADGMLDRNERAILDGLAARLGLTAEETARIEREASRA